MKFLKGLFKRPVTIIYSIIVAIVLGIMATLNMPINLLPEMKFPLLSVQTTYVGADAETIDKEVTDPLEKALSQVSGVHEISTYSLNNASIIILEFDYGTNTESKKDDINEKMGNVKLPEGCDSPTISSIDLNSQSMFSLTVYSETKSMDEVYLEANKIKNELSSIQGAGSVTLSGAPITTLKVETINGLEMFAGLLTKDLVTDSSLDIPLGEIILNGDKITINNHSKAETIEDIKNTTIGIEMSSSYITMFKSLQENIQKIEDMNVEDTEKMKEDADGMNEFIDKIEESTNDELDDMVDNLSEIKSLVETIENNTAGGLKIMWNQVLKNLFEDEDFKNLTDDELHQMADQYNISYGLLKWAQDNSEVNPDTGKTYAEEKWEIIVAFREAHPDDIEDSEYAQLFYDIELVSPDENDEDYMASDDITDAVKLSRNINVVALDNVVEKIKNDEEVTNADYASLFVYAGNDSDLPINEYTIRMIRDINFEDNYKIFYEYKKTHVHDETKLDEEGNEYTESVGNPISSKDFMTMYNQMKFEEEIELDPTERLIDFVRDVDFTSSSVKVKVSQMADVYIETKYESKAYYNSIQAIQIDIYGGGGANATALAKEAKKIIEKYNLSTTSFKAVELNSQADFISDSLSNALVSLLIGSLLAVLVIYLFLRKVKSSFIIAVSMPLSVLLTLGCLYLMGISLNMVSVGGIAVGIGMLVDNSIVVLESVTSEKEKGKDVLTASVDGVKLVFGSLIGSTLTSICVFFPILFIQGLTKEIFGDLSWAVIFSLSFSLLVAVTVIPSLFCLFYRKPEKEKKVTKKKDKVPFFDKLNSWYINFLNKVLKHKVVTVLVAMGVFLGSLGLIFTLPIEFLPSIDQHKIQINVNFEAGTDYSECQNKTMEAYSLIMNNTENIKYLSQSVGYSGLIQTNIQGVITLQLEDNAKASKLVMEDIRNTLETNNYDVDYSVLELDGVVASITGSMSGISLSIYGDSVETLKEIADKVESDVVKKNGIKHASDNMLSKSSSYSIKFNPDLIVEKGLDYSTVVQTLRVGLAGYDIYEINEDDLTYNATVSWKSDTIGGYYESLAKFVVGLDSESSEFVHLEDVGDITLEYGRHVIRKVNGKNVLTISVECFGIDTNTAGKYLSKSASDVLKDYEGYTYASGGVSSYLNDAFRGLIIALIISFFLLFGVMACLFESLRKPIIIIFSFPFAFAGGFLALAISRVSLNVVSFIGLIMLMGVIINDAIVLNERFDQLREDGLDPKDAVIEGCRQRLRAVLMTTLTTVLALIPMALGLGKGGALMQPLGIVAIGGMTIGTLVTLILIPSVYSIMYRISYNNSKKKEKAEEIKDVQ